MRRKLELKDWVHKLMDENPIVTYGPNARVVLKCARTGKRRVDHIRRDWWVDEDFRDGYEALRADEGFMIVGELNEVRHNEQLCLSSVGTRIECESGNVADFASGECSADQ
jgi:hypothetical protein